MEEHFNILVNFLDVVAWLLKLGIDDPFELEQVTHTAINQTSEKFNKSYEDIKDLVTRRELAQTKSEAEIVTFYFEYLRKIQVSRQ